MTGTRRGFLQKLGIGVAGVMLAANLDLGYRPPPKLTHAEVIEALTLPFDGTGLRAESLEHTLKNATFDMEHVMLWKKVPKEAAYNTVEEHSRLTAGMPAYKPPLTQRIREFIFGKPKLGKVTFLDHDPFVRGPTPRWRRG